MMNYNPLLAAIFSVTLAAAGSALAADKSVNKALITKQSMGAKLPANISMVPAAAGKSNDLPRVELPAKQQPSIELPAVQANIPTKSSGSGASKKPVPTTTRIAPGTADSMRRTTSAIKLDKPARQDRDTGDGTAGPNKLDPKTVGRMAPARVGSNIVKGSFLNPGLTPTPTLVGKPRQLPAIRSPAFGDGALGDRASRIEQANQARGLKELDAMRGLQQDLTRIDPMDGDALGLTGGNRGGFGSALRGNRGSGNSGGFGSLDGPLGGILRGNQNGRGAAPLTPSMNPRDWMGGATSQDGGAEVTKSPSGVVTKTWEHEGTTYEDTSFPRGDGVDHDHHMREERRGDGTSTTVQTWTREDGSGYMHMTGRDSNFRVTYGRNVVFGPGREVESDLTSDNPTDRYPRWRPGPMHPDQMQDPNAPGYDSEFARWAARFDHSRKSGPPLINRVNPGPEGATPENEGPRLDPGQSIVINPSTEDPSRTGGLPWGAAENRARIEDALPGPGANPGEPQ